jgi:hypothetical protein
VVVDNWKNHNAIGGKSMCHKSVTGLRHMCISMYRDPMYTPIGCELGAIVLFCCAIVLRGRAITTPYLCIRCNCANVLCICVVQL